MANHGKGNITSQGTISAEKQQSIANAQFNASQVIGKIVATTLKGLQKEVSQRTYRASNELRNASLYVLRGTRSGKVYKMPETYGDKPSKATKKLMRESGHKLRKGGQLYRASAPGEPPAVRTGAFLLSWGTHVHVEKKGVHFRAVAAIESKERAGGKLLGEILENGTGKMKPRPYKQAIVDRALPKVKEIYKKPYKGG